MVLNPGAPPVRIITRETLLMILPVISEILCDTHASLHDVADRRRSYWQKSSLLCGKDRGWRKKREKGEMESRGEEVESERFPDSKI
jgi:hypothetical protein